MLTLKSIFNKIVWVYTQMSNQQHHFTYYKIYYYIEQNIATKKCRLQNQFEKDSIKIQQHLVSSQYTVFRFSEVNPWGEMLIVKRWKHQQWLVQFRCLQILVRNWIIWRLNNSAIPTPDKNSIRMVHTIQERFCSTYSSHNIYIPYKWTYSVT